MNTAVTPQKASDIIEAIITKGDIAQLSAQERARYYVRVCESIGLNPMTRPFEYIVLNGKLTLYARKDATDQLRSIYGVSVTDLTEATRDGVFIVTAKVADKAGRTDMATGAVSVASLRGEFLANAIMKAETKAKRRATLSICGLGFLDESELPERRPPLTDRLETPHTSGSPTATEGNGGRHTPKDESYVPHVEDPDAGSFNDAGERGPDPVLEPPDFVVGRNDAEHGRTGCLNSDIKNDPDRYADWQRGFDSYKPKRKR